MDIRDASTAAANVVEQFRLYMEKGSVEKNAFFAHLESCDKTLEVLHRVYTKFLEKKKYVSDILLKELKNVEI